jgi:putative restriction endonuclease
MSNDYEYRKATFDWLDLQVEMYGSILPYGLLAAGFEYGGHHITIASMRGIWKPKVFDYPISIRTAIDNPYQDTKGNGVIRYKYFGDDPNHSDNNGLRRAMKEKVPLVYLPAVAKGKYRVEWPVFITGDDPVNKECTVAVDQKEFILSKPKDDVESILRRRYVTAAVQVRLHQSIFRERVLEAYKEHCSFCNLKHPELLDAAHIVPDKEEEGIPHVSNGLALCKIHHAAFDRNILGVRPDYVIEVRRDVLGEKDGLMLQYGLQSLHNKDMILPSRKNDYPSTELLGKRWEKFRKAI